LAPEQAERIAIESDADVVTARQRARALAVGLDMPTTDQTLLATAISEIARNITAYAVRGEVLVGVVRGDNGRRGVRVVARDDGPGIEDIQLALTKQQSDGTQVPYLVAGNGGYHNLHSIMKVDGEKMIAPVVFDDKDNDPVTLEKYCDDHWGFVRLEVTDQLVTGRFYQVPRPQEPFSKGNQLLDYFEFDWKARKYVPNTLSR